MDELRRKGLEKMNEVYGWEMPNIEGDAYFDLTVDHLFGSIWTRPGLSMRDKRIMTLTAVTAVGNRDLAEIQINAALLNGELTETELKEMAVFLTHYLGFPLGSALNGAVDAVVAKRKKAAAKGAGEDKKANVNAALLNGELTETELKEMAVFLTHYLGFPLGSALNGAVDTVVAKRKKAAAKGAGEDKKANVDAALKMHSGNTLD